MEESLFAQAVMCFVTDLSPTRQFTVLYTLVETIPIVGNLFFKYKLNLHRFFSLSHLSIDPSVLDL
jgi:hypothetical protein